MILLALFEASHLLKIFNSFRFSTFSTFFSSLYFVFRNANFRWIKSKNNWTPLTSNPANKICHIDKLFRILHYPFNAMIPYSTNTECFELTPIYIITNLDNPRYSRTYDTFEEKKFTILLHRASSNRKFSFLD